MKKIKINPLNKQGKKLEGKLFSVKIELDSISKDLECDGSESIWINFWADNMKQAKIKARACINLLRNGGVSLDYSDVEIDECSISQMSFNFEKISI